MLVRRDENTIYTPRLLLRQLTAADAPAIVAGIDDYSVSKWLTKVPHPFGLEDAQGFIEADGDGTRFWAITRNGAFLGVMSIGNELGYWLAASAQGQGFATEAGFAVVDHWFGDPGNDNLLSGHFSDNAASGRVLEKIGFEHMSYGRLYSRAQGREVESHMMSLSRTRWQNLRSLPHLATPRLTTRPLRASDAASMAEIAGIEAIARNTSSIPSPWTESDARAWIGAGTWDNAPGFRLAICDHLGRLVGMAGLSPMDETGASSLAYLLKKSLWGRGLITELMASFVPAAFRAFPLRALTADHYTDNPASGAILRKLGFDHVGTGVGTSLARLEPAPISLYRLERSRFEEST